MTTPTTTPTTAPTTAPTPERVLPDRRYRSVPLPDTWAPLLAALTPAPIVRKSVAFPALQPLIAAHLPQDPRTRDILWDRLARGRSLEEVAGPLRVTRERVRQLEFTFLRPLSRFRYRPAQEGLPLIRAALPPIGEELLEGLLGDQDVRLLDLSGTEAAYPDGTPDEHWRYLGRLRRATQGYGAPVTGHLVVEADAGRFGPSTALLTRMQRPGADEIRAALNAPPAFLSGAQLATRLATPDSGRRWTEQALAAAWPAIPGLTRTHAGSYRCDDWNAGAWLTAVATQLHRAGHRTWHFSQLHAAVEAVRETTLSVYNTRTLLARMRDVFEPGARPGSWALNTRPPMGTDEMIGALLNDGHAWSLKAVQAALAPQRRVTLQTLHALLETPAYRCVGQQTYRLVTAAQVTAAQVTAAQVTAAQVTAAQVTAAQVTAAQTGPARPG